MPLYVCNRATPDAVYRFPDDVVDGGTPSGTDVTIWNLPTNINNPDAIVTYQGEILVTDDTQVMRLHFSMKAQRAGQPQH